MNPERERSAVPSDEGVDSGSGSGSVVSDTRDIIDYTSDENFCATFLSQVFMEVVDVERFANINYSSSDEESEKELKDFLTSFRLKSRNLSKTLERVQSLLNSAQLSDKQKKAVHIVAQRLRGSGKR